MALVASDCSESLEHALNRPVGAEIVVPTAPCTLDSHRFRRAQHDVVQVEPRRPRRGTDGIEEPRPDDRVQEDAVTALCVAGGGGSQGPYDDLVLVVRAAPPRRLPPTVDEVPEVIAVKMDAG